MNLMLGSLVSIALVVSQVAGQSTLGPHASTAVVRFVHSSGAYSLEHPADWKAHESATRVNIGADDGLVAGERGFRTVYGAIVAIVDDPAAAQADRTLDASARAILEAILARNPHQAIAVPLHDDAPFAGAPAVAARLLGTSPVTGRGERVDIVCRAYGQSQIFYVMLVAPDDAPADVDGALRRLRDSVRLTGGR